MGYQVGRRTVPTWDVESRPKIEEEDSGDTTTAQVIHRATVRHWVGIEIATCKGVSFRLGASQEDMEAYR